MGVAAHLPEFSEWTFTSISSRDNARCSLGAVFILVVSSAVLVDDVSARAGDVSMGSLSFLLAEFSCWRSKIRATVRLRQSSTNIQPMRKKVIYLKHVKLHLDT